MTRLCSGLCLLLAVLFLPGCTLLRQAAEEEAEERARRAAPGQIPAEDIPAHEKQVTVNSVLPSRGLTVGGLLVEVVGLGFEPDALVRFGDMTADPDLTDVLSENRIQVITPTGEPGMVPVTVTTSVASGTLDKAFEFYAPVAILAVSPGRGPTHGGTRVVVTGTGFVADTVVYFGDRISVAAQDVTAGQLSVTAPPLPPGRHNVTVVNHNGAATLPQSFHPFEPVRVTRVVPFAGPWPGNFVADIRGSGFVPGSAVTVDLISQMVSTGNPEETSLQVLVRPRPAVFEGAVDVRVENEYGSHTLANGFVFYDPDSATARVISISPPTGPVAGGTLVQIAGVGFEEPDTEAHFGGTWAPCTTMTDHMLTCLAPPGSVGPVDVEVKNSRLAATVADGFTYVELGLDVIIPSNGAQAGGTYVEVFGKGFAPDAVVLVGGAPARDLQVVSQSRMSLRTPPGPAGSTTVTVVSQGVETSNSDLFSYYDPYRSGQWSWGGPIEGSVNVTVIDQKKRVADAFVMLGIDSNPVCWGFTDGRGQITLSGPKVRGLQTVTAGKSERGLFSWVMVDAMNLTLVLTPEPTTYTPNTDLPPPPPVIKGRISRIKDEYNLGDDPVRVTTTYASFSMPLPDPGPGANLINQGNYELWSRTGDLMVIAMAGTERPGHGFVAHAVGLCPFLFTEAGSGTVCEANEDCPADEACYDFGEGATVCTHVYEPVDIVVDIPLSQAFEIHLVDPPFASPADVDPVPDTASASVFYDFGYLGLHPLDDIAIPFSDLLVVPMPQNLPLELQGSVFTVRAGVYRGYDGDGDPDTPVTLHLPLSEIYVEGLADPSQPLWAAPLLGIPVATAPADGESASTPLRLATLVNRDIMPSSYVHYLWQGQSFFWMIMTPPDVLDFSLPTLPDVVASLRPTSSESSGQACYWQALALYSQGALFNQLDAGTLFDWHSRAAAMSSFMVP